MNKSRNKMIAVVCLLLFAGLGVAYFRNWVVQKPFGVILFIGDGFTGSKLAAARLYKDGGERLLFSETLPHMAILRNQGLDFAVPDAAAAASLIATGQRVGQRHLSMRDGRQLTTLLNQAKDAGRAVGIVTNATIADPTLAAFYSHTNNATERDSIILQLVENHTADVILGGGRNDFLPDSKGGTRRDGRDLLLKMSKDNFIQVRSKNELENVPSWQFPQVLGLFAEAQMPYSDDVTSGAEVPSLADMVRQAIGLLQYNRNGYFLIVDAGLIAEASATNQGERVLREMVELDQAIETAVRYAGKNTLLIATAKHSTGGFTMNGYPLIGERGMALVGRNSQGIPSLTWSTGPRAERSNEAPASERLSDEPVAVFRERAADTVEDVIAVGFGEGTQKLNGFQDASCIFHILSEGM